MPTDEQILNEKEAAKLLGLATPTIRRWRCEGRGPSYVKLGKAVRYKRSIVEAWRDARFVDLGASTPN
jgi:excisionase family DNA binding protein